MTGADDHWRAVPQPRPWPGYRSGRSETQWQAAERARVRPAQARHREQLHEAREALQAALAATQVDEATITSLSDDLERLMNGQYRADPAPVGKATAKFGGRCPVPRAPERIV